MSVNNNKSHNNQIIVKMTAPATTVVLKYLFPLNISFMKLKLKIVWCCKCLAGSNTSF